MKKQLKLRKITEIPLKPPKWPKSLKIYRTLQQAIGLNFATLDGLGTLGTTVIIVELNSLRRELDWKNEDRKSVV